MGRLGEISFARKYILCLPPKKKKKVNEKKLPLGLKVIKVIKAFLLALALCNSRVSNQVMQIIIFFYLEVCICN